jgi:hypothetical protein
MKFHRNKNRLLLKAAGMKLIYILFFTFLFASAHPQQLQPVAHPPCTEIYDLLIDKKGFLWVAHNLGISRYDGISFTSFSNPAQSSLSVTDLIEDNYGTYLVPQL